MAAEERPGRFFRVDVYRRFIKYFWPYKGTMAVVVGLTVLSSVIALAAPWPMKFLVDSGLSGKPLPDWLHSLPFMSDPSATTIIVLAVVAFFLLRAITTVLGVVEEYLKTRVNWQMVVRFKADLFEHLQKLSFSYHDRVPVGDSIYRVEEDSNFISTLVWSNFRHTLTSLITFVGMLVILLRLDWGLTLVALATIPISFAAIGISANRFRAQSKRIKAMESAGQTIVQEVLSALRVVKSFGQEPREQRRFENQIWQAMRARLRLLIQEESVGAGVSMLGVLNRAAILLVGALHVHSGQLTIGELLVVLAYTENLYWPIETLGGVLTDMQLSLASAERTIEVFDVDPEIEDRPAAVALASVSGGVAFRGVTFAYATGHPVLHDVSFEASPGTTTAIVGPTGAGKSTMASLLVRFYDPSTGSVTLDGHDLRDIRLDTIRENVALVLQEPILFSGSVRENIAYGHPDAPLPDIVAAAKAANAHEFVEALEDGYDTEAGQRGMRFSGGERQRIAIARAFLKDAPVMILDEPTSAIDVHTEAVILEALDRLVVGRTTFIIAHRLSTLRRADQVLIVEAGRIADQGSHEELLGRSEFYAELHRLHEPEPSAPIRLAR